MKKIILSFALMAFANEAAAMGFPKSVFAQQRALYGHSKFKKNQLGTIYKLSFQSQPKNDSFGFGEAFQQISTFVCTKIIQFVHQN